MFEGVKAGIFTDKDRGTGATVFLFGSGAVVSFHASGFAVGARQLMPCEPEHVVPRVHALMFTGGSAFGLDAASGVVRFLEERKLGFETPYATVPIVPSAVIFDLSIGDHTARPTPDDLYSACVNASPLPPPSGCAGAGTGATVGKLYGIELATKAGQGWADTKIDGCGIAAFCVMNAFGDVVDPETKRIVAGARSPDDGWRFADTARAILESETPRSAFEPSNTVLTGVLTEARLDKVQARMLARSAGAAIAKVVRPFHTPYDGDICFAASAGNKELHILKLMVAAQELVVRAALDAVRSAEGMLGLPSAGDIGSHGR